MDNYSSCFLPTFPRGVFSLNYLHYLHCLHFIYSTFSSSSPLLLPTFLSMLFAFFFVRLSVRPPCYSIWVFRIVYSTLLYSILFCFLPNHSTCIVSTCILFIYHFFLSIFNYIYFYRYSYFRISRTFPHDPAQLSYNPPARPPHDHVTMPRFHAFYNLLAHDPHPHDPRTAMLPCHRVTDP